MMGGGGGDDGEKVEDDKDLELDLMAEQELLRLTRWVRSSESNTLFSPAFLQKKIIFCRYSSFLMFFNVAPDESVSNLGLFSF